MSPTYYFQVQKSATRYTEAARDEVILLQQIAAGDPCSQNHCVCLYDSFEHLGPHGCHVCMVFEVSITLRSCNEQRWVKEASAAALQVLGDNLLCLIKGFNYQGIPLQIVRRLTKQILIGLDYLHSNLKIIHTDLKPENVMLTQSIRDKTQSCLYDSRTVISKGSLPIGTKSWKFS